MTEKSDKRVQSIGEFESKLVEISNEVAQKLGQLTGYPQLFTIIVFTKERSFYTFNTDDPVCMVDEIEAILETWKKASQPGSKTSIQ